MTFPLRAPAICAAALSLLCLAPAHAAKPAKADPVVMSFATVGDSRTDAATAQTRQDKLFLQNTKALARIFREVEAARPAALFFNGDMIMGYTSDVAIINRQYAYWRGMAAQLMESGTYVLPVSGNHEMQFKGKDADGKGIKVARTENEQTWRDNMGDLIVDVARFKAVTGKEASAFDVANAPAVGGPDQIQTSQSQLSYSFDVGNSHFAVINTDPVGNDGHGPAHWLEDDFSQAKARGATHFFAFGHKPAYTYYFKPGIERDGMDIYPDNATAFWSVIERYKGAYFCGHQHIFNAQQPALAAGGKAWQIMVGSGGSPFSAKPGDTRNPQDRMVAWALVRVHASGKVQVDVYGFDEHGGKTVRLKSLQL